MTKSYAGGKDDKQDGLPKDSMLEWRMTPRKKQR